MNKTSKQKAGRLGGLATVRNHGKAHMQAIGRKGAATFWKRYNLLPAGASGWVIVRKDTGEFVNFR